MGWAKYAEDINEAVEERRDTYEFYKSYNHEDDIKGIYPDYWNKQEQENYKHIYNV